jgi:hypothetical protein
MSSIEEFINEEEIEEEIPEEELPKRRRVVGRIPKQHQYVYRGPREESRPQPMPQQVIYREPRQQQMNKPSLQQRVDEEIYIEIAKQQAIDEYNRQMQQKPRISMAQHMKNVAYQYAMGDGTGAKINNAITFAKPAPVRASVNKNIASHWNNYIADIAPKPKSTKKKRK